jgi:hypothetical protein
MDPQPQRQQVVVTDVNMPFGSMVRFMVKWALASIPAFMILFIVGFFCAGVFSAIVMSWSPFTRSEPKATATTTTSAAPEAVAPVREPAEKPVMPEEPKAEPGVMRTIRTEYVYADATTRTFHRPNCPDKTAADVKVYREVAEQEGYSPHSVCVNFEPEAAFRVE